MSTEQTGVRRHEHGCHLKKEEREQNQLYCPGCLAILRSNFSYRSPPGAFDLPVFQSLLSHILQQKSPNWGNMLYLRRAIEFAHLWKPITFSPRQAIKFKFAQPSLPCMHRLKVESPPAPRVPQFYVIFGRIHSKSLNCLPAEENFNNSPLFNSNLLFNINLTICSREKKTFAVLVLARFYEQNDQKPTKWVMVANFEQQRFALHSSKIDAQDFWCLAKDDLLSVKRNICSHSYFDYEKKMVYLGKLASLPTSSFAKVKSMAKVSTSNIFNTFKATKADSEVTNFETIDVDKVTDWTATRIKLSNITPGLFEQPQLSSTS